LALDPVAPLSTPGTGWWVDDITISGLVEPGPCVKQGCGDGIVDAGEECDTGGFNSDTTPDACRTNCTAPSCGDGVTDSGEGCDDGAANSDSAVDACRSDCQPAGCGDGVVDSGELCDDGAGNSDTAPDACRTHCLPASCGDGTIDSDEVCDDGLLNSDSQADACRTYCLPAGCGDGVGDTGEECDNGASNSNSEPDACRMNCTAAGCGDAVTDSAEACDDGNQAAGDGCSAVCQAEVSAPEAEPVPRDKNRFVSFVIDPVSEGVNVAIRVRLVTVHDTVVPPDAPDLSMFEGQVRYVNTFRDEQNNPVLTCADSASHGTSFQCAKLGCAPEYRDWTNDASGEALHVTGSAVVPSSVYAIALIPTGCAGTETNCALASAELTTGTPRWGNVNGDMLVNAVDIAEVVDKVKDMEGALTETETVLQPQEPAPARFAVNAGDIAAAVDAVKGMPYRYGIAACP
jgi:cysteine-rich repeat protein